MPGYGVSVKATHGRQDVRLRVLADHLRADPHWGLPEKKMCSEVARWVCPPAPTSLNGAFCK